MAEQQTPEEAPRRQRGRRNRTSNGRYAHIVGWGVEVPERVLSNYEIESFVETSDQWIRDRTGIAERRIADDRDTTVTLGLRAARKALNQANILPRDIDLIIVATSTPMNLFPATANLIQDRLGAARAGAFDLLAACTGFIYGLGLAASHIEAGSAEVALVIGTETLSRIVDWTDRGTCVLFGDGAGAFVLRASETPGGVRQVVLHSDGSGANHLYAHSGMRDTWQGVHPEQSLVMNGREVFRFASRAMVQATEEVLDNAGLSIDDVDMIVPHQANLRIIQSAARGLNLPMERFVTNIERYGNTSTASIPLALVEGVEEGVIQPNNRIVLVGFGAGLTWGAAILEWDVIPTARSRFTEVLHEGWYIFAHLRSFVRRLLRLIEAIIWAPREPRSQSTQPEPEASDEPADNEDEQPPEA